MYSTSISMEFRARHFLPNATLPLERKMHTHSYVMEVTVTGRELDKNGYLLDLDKMETIMKRIVSSLSGHVLNGLPDIVGRTPSIEVLANIIWSRFVKWVDTPRIQSATVRVWEGENASASFSGDVR